MPGSTLNSHQEAREDGNVKNLTGTVLALTIGMIFVGILFVALSGAGDALIQVSHNLIGFP
jgi:hypothetical protein